MKQDIILCDTQAQAPSIRVGDCGPKLEDSDSASSITDKFTFLVTIDLHVELVQIQDILKKKGTHTIFLAVGITCFGTLFFQTEKTQQ